MREGDHQKSRAHSDAAAARHIAENLHRPKPPAPAYLTPGARAVWAEVTDAMPADHFDPGDARSLAAYCEACAMVERLSRELETQPVVVTDDDGVSKQNPFYRTFYSAVNSVQTFAVRLKLLPSTRTKDAAGTKRAARMMRAAGSSARAGLLFQPRTQGDVASTPGEDWSDDAEPSVDDLLS